MNFLNLIWIMILVLAFIYLKSTLKIENFNSYQTYQSFIPLSQYFYPLGMPPNPSLPLNPYMYKYPLYYPINPLFNSPYLFNIPLSNGYTNLPWWNTPIGNKRNMSWDIRGDPVQIPKTEFVWNNGTTFPIYNKSI